MIHTLVCRTDSNKWSVNVRERSTVPWATTHKGNQLRAALEASFAFDPLEHAWTFSERMAPEVMADMAEEVEQINSISGSCDTTVYCPEGRFEGAADDRWATLYYYPGAGPLWSTGPSGLFRPRTLRTQIMEAFFGIGHDENVFKTFVGGKYGIKGPVHKRELWVRPHWKARQIAPGSFPALPPQWAVPTPRPTA